VQWLSLLADPGDGTRIIGHGTMVTPGLGSAGFENAAFGREVVLEPVTK
jgi:hypothetical protein